MPWLIPLLGTLLSRAFAFFGAYFSFKIAKALSLSTLLIAVFSGFFMSLVFAVRSMVEYSRVTMPPILANATYFLPSDLPVVLSAIITFRISVAIYNWTMSNFGIYTNAVSPGTNLPTVYGR